MFVETVRRVHYEKRFVILILCIILCIFAGCSNKPETVNAKIEGSFCVMVRDVIPDYCLDDFTPQVAIVTEFQSSPYTVYLGEDLASKVEPGKAYVFTIESKEIGEISEDLLDNYINPVKALYEYNARIESIRPAEKEEWGLEGPILKYVIIE